MKKMFAVGDVVFLKARRDLGIAEIINVLHFPGYTRTDTSGNTYHFMEKNLYCLRFFDDSLHKTREQYCFLDIDIELCSGGAEKVMANFNNLLEDF